jgi:hypothetical protein
LNEELPQPTPSLEEAIDLGLLGAFDIIDIFAIEEQLDLFKNEG